MWSYTDHSDEGIVFANTFSSIYSVCHLLSHLLMYYGSLYIANTMDPDQTAPLGAVWSGFKELAPMTKEA